MDDKNKLGRPDRDLINISEPYEVSDWADKFGVTNVKLKAVVNIVGNSAKKVEAYLTKNK